MFVVLAVIETFDFTQIYIFSQVGFDVNSIFGKNLLWSFRSFWVVWIQTSATTYWKKQTCFSKSRTKETSIYYRLHCLLAYTYNYLHLYTPACKSIRTNIILAITFCFVIFRLENFRKFVYSLFLHVLKNWRWNPMKMVSGVCQNITGFITEVSSKILLCEKSTGWTSSR
jgi:hypothetical protein